MKAVAMLTLHLKCASLAVFTFYKIWTKYIGLERVIWALFLSERKRKTENIIFQGHCIGFQVFRGKTNRFQGPQGQLFKFKVFKVFKVHWQPWKRH